MIEIYHPGLTGGEAKRVNESLKTHGIEFQGDRPPLESRIQSASPWMASGAAKGGKGKEVKKEVWWKHTQPTERKLHSRLWFRRKIDSTWEEKIMYEERGPITGIQVVPVTKFSYFLRIYIYGCLW